MAVRQTPVKKAWRSLGWLIALIVGMFALNLGGVLWAGGTWTPKLALDLEGGTQIILAPKLESGQEVKPEQLDQAVAIIRQRIDASGVSEAEINTQGGKNVVVSIPGTKIDDETRNRIESSAKLEFRPVIAATSSANTVVQPSESPAPTDSPTVEPSSEPTAEPTPTVSPTDASDDAWITPALQDQFNAFDCKNIESSGANVAPTDEPLITCDDTGTEKFILGPVEVSGETISDASAGLIPNSQGATTNEWGVNLVFNAQGAKEFGKVTTRLYGETGNKNRFAIVLDGSVISAPTTRAVITDGKAQISGNFTQQSAKVLADQLKFGALPIGFEVQSSETISATLGTSQLQSGLLAGILGLILVMIYTMFQYRALGSVTIASLVVAGVMTYLVITILSWREGYRLSLAGVAGLIVAIGFTADSFIIYFERVRDELREGRVIVSAVEAGWKRALKTVYAAKGTNLLAAIVLFIVAVGNVRGFALTLGITTIIDVIIVVLFTHPMLQLLARTKFFGDGHPLSGLDPMAHGAVYRGAGEFRVIREGKGKSALSSSKEAARRQTIAERKAAEAAELAAKGKK